MYFSFPPLNAQLTLSGVLVAVFRVCGNGDYGVCYVSQHEEILRRAPRFRVAYQAPHAVAGDGTRAVAGDGTHGVAAEAPHVVAADGTHAVAADRRGPPATLLLSPRVLNCPSSLPALNAQLTSSGVIMTIFRVCGNGDYGVCYVSQHEEILRRAPRFRVAYQAPLAVAGDGTHAVAGDGSYAVSAEASQAVAADGTHAVAGDGSHAVAADRHARACATAAARRDQRRGPGPPQTAPRVPHAGGEQKYKVSTRPPATLPLSPRVLKCIFPFLALNAQLTSSGVIMTIFRVCGNGDYGVCYVSQHEEISTRAPRFCVAYQAPHAVAGDGSHAVARDGSHAVAAEAPHAVAAEGTHAVAAEASHAVAADRQARACAAAAARRARRQGPGPPQTAPRVPHTGGEKNYKVSTRDPATLPLPPRVLKCVFLFHLSMHNSPCGASSWPFLESAVMAIMVLTNMKRYQRVLLDSV
jgi:hypothetical protein